jgi:hypothetical protein
MEFRTTVMVEVYRACCPDCGIKMETVPQSPSKAPFSKRFEDAVGQACESARRDKWRFIPRRFESPHKSKPALDRQSRSRLGAEPACTPSMRSVLLATLLASAVLPKFSQSPRPLPKAWKVRSQWSKDNCLSVAEAMPESKYSFIPTAGKFDGVPSFADRGSTRPALSSRSSTK